MSRVRGMAFTGESVRAILAGRKTQTRRVVRPQPPNRHIEECLTDHRTTWQLPLGQSNPCFLDSNGEHYAPRYQPGDIVYVREALVRGDRIEAPAPLVEKAFYRADATIVLQGDTEEGESLVDWEWNRPVLSARFMPRWAARIWLEVTGVRAEWLQDISEEDAGAEGLLSIVWPFPGAPRRIFSRSVDDEYYFNSAHEAYRAMWDALHARDGHTSDTNPLVWVYTLKLAARKEGA